MSARASILALAVLVPASSLTAQDAYRYGSIRTVDPGVTLQRASEAAAEVAVPNLPFLPGDRVWTDDAGRMEVQFADGSILRLDSRSKLDYVTHDGGRRAERVVLRLWSGALFLHFRDERRSPDFTIETPEGVLEPSERGVYRLDVGPGEARVAVLEGEATVEAGRRVRVSRGEEVVVREGELSAGPDRIEGLAANDEFARWDGELEEQVAYADGRGREEWLPEEVSPYGSDFATYGTWGAEAEYGNVWYPRVDVGWSPYSRGYWAWTPYGWTWVPNERWGWATSHYGRWGHGGRGWYWIPGQSWGPGWVSWSVGSSHVGWCPLGWGDRPVFVREHSRKFRGHAVRRGTAVQAENVIAPWTYVRRGDMGQRDLARRKVDPTQVATGELRVAPAGHSRLSRDLRLVDGAVGSGQPSAGGAVPRNIRLKPTIGDTVPELRTDPTTTIRRPIPRRHREPDEGSGAQPRSGVSPRGPSDGIHFRREPPKEAVEGGQPAQGGQSGSRVGVPRAPRAAPLTPGAAAAPRPQRAPAEVGTGQWSEREEGGRRDVQRARPDGSDGEAARERGERDRDRETLRPIFGPLSRPRSDDGAAQDRGKSRRDDGSSDGGPASASPRRERGGSERSGSEGGGRPSGMSNAPRPAAPPPSKPPADRAQPRGERSKPKDRD